MSPRASKAPRTAGGRSRAALAAAAVAALCLLVGGSGIAAPAPPPLPAGLLYGDLNLDGNRDIFDLVIQQGYIVGNIPQGVAPFVAPLQAADTLADGATDIFDAVVLAAFLVGNVPSLPQLPVCDYQVLPTGESFGAAGGSSTVNVTVATGCQWSATSNDAWILITLGGTGSGNGSVDYTVAANPSSVSRNGSLTVAGQTVSITQAGAGCSFQVLPTSDSFGAAGGSDTVGVTAPPGCAWSAAANDGWITVTSGASGSGDGSVGYTVAANASSLPRSGSLTVAGEAVTISQDGVACTYQLSTTGEGFGAAGGSETVDVTAPPGCAWNATPNDPWISITSGAPGNGNGTVVFQVAANPSSIQRVGTLTVAGQTVTATQDGVACTYQVAPTSDSFGAAGGADTVGVTAPAGCAWTATANDPWINVTSGASGNGNGSAGYTVSANPSSVPRSGTLTVAGQTVTINQDGVACTYQVFPTSDSFGSAGGSDTVGVTAPPGCAWTATPNDAWITIDSGTPGSGNGSVGYTVAANTGAARTGSLTVAGQNVGISQAGGSVDLEASLSCDAGSPPNCTVASVGNVKVLAGSVKNNGTLAVPAGEARVTLSLGTGTPPDETEIGAGYAGVGAGWALETGVFGGKVVTLVSTAPVPAGQTVAVEITIATPGLGYVQQNSVTVVSAADTNPTNDAASFILVRGE